MEPEGRNKKRRLRGACDNCKKRKTKCDSSKMPNHRCSTCITLELPNLGSAKSYVESLEQRIAKLEKLFRKYLPGLDLIHEVDRTTLDEDDTEDDLPIRNDDDSPEARLVSQITKLKLRPDENRFYGKSSNVMLVKATLDLKNHYHVEKKVPWVYKRPEVRPEFSEPRPWQVRPAGSGQMPMHLYKFPPEDLLEDLVELYFKKVNLFLPLLHRPTFQRYIDEGTHFRDREFAHVLLLVCGVASRYSDDPRVFVEGTADPEVTGRNYDLHSAGWPYVSQVNHIQPVMSVRPSLFEVQAYSLSTLWNEGSSIPQGTWTEVGLGLRKAMEVGAHRKTPGRPTAQGELWKRAFWVLVCQDIHISAFYGHSSTLSSHMYDQDLPIACDDEYWDMNFKQPEGKPSTIEYFNQYIRLVEIHASAMRAVYYTKKPTLTPARPSDQQTMFMLDSALNSWREGLPPHLRWDSKEPDQTRFDHAACLAICYYHLQIFVHKPFITPLHASSHLTFPSLAICTSAARSCARVADAQTQGVLERDAQGAADAQDKSSTNGQDQPATDVHAQDASVSQLISLPHFHTAVSVAGFVLILNVWTGKQAGLSPNPRDMKDVRRCMRMLKAWEARWHNAGRLWDLQKDLVGAADVEEMAGARQGRKRRREEVEMDEQEADHGTSPATTNSSLVVTPQHLYTVPNSVHGPAVSAVGQQGSTGQDDTTLDFITGYMNSQEYPTDEAGVLPGLTGMPYPTISMGGDAGLSSLHSQPRSTDFVPGILTPSLESDPFLEFGVAGDSLQGLGGMGGDGDINDNFQFTFSMPAGDVDMSAWNMPLGLGEDDHWSQYLSSLEGLTTRPDEDAGPGS
ncbi:fungal-specific transcription factor domain-containing protein [Schizophyllum amplum]|uniref:Fungal-specific transcription factor domain-containing protein n=1 Tax=Schizophyllum amplum TaxID=97359 RepID=A0A550CGE2_9AGAR|nr:fungal-specific transcription factor domain-containing protein [Auriculariopsis ampla]